MKHCRKCQQAKPLEEFNRCQSASDNRQPKCRECEARYRAAHKERIKAQQDQYREENKDLVKTRNKTWREANPDKVREMAREYNTKNKDHILEQKRAYYAENKQDRLAYQREWAATNEIKMREYRREYMKEYRRTNPNYAIRHRVSNRIRELLVNGKEGRHTEDYLGCSILVLRKHLESLFTEGMTWERFLSGEIHIDHIRPCCSFDLTKPEEQAICFHYTNLQPLWAADNLSKRSQDLAAQRDKRDESRVSTLTNHPST